MTWKKLYLFVLAVLWALVAVLLAVGAVQMYAEGAAIQAGGDLFYYIYTREKVGEKIAPLLPLIFAALMMTIVGWLMGIKDVAADAPARDVEIQRNLTCARVQSPSAAMAAERSKQRRLCFGGWLAFALCMVPIAMYVVNPANLDRPLDTEADLFALLRTFVPCTALGIASLAVSAILSGRSMVRETEAAKAQIASEKAAGIKPEPIHTPIKAVPQDGGRVVLCLRIAFIALAVMLIIAGIQNGGLEDVLTKANAICMECVGLG